MACFDCHANGHTNGATHLVGDIRPQEFRHRIDTPSLRGVNIQRLFGSQRALKTRRGLHRVRAARRLLRRRPGDRHEEGRQHPRARQPGALHGRVPGAARLPAGAQARRRSASSTRRRRRDAELRGQALFFGKAQCASCHPPPYYTDNLMHNLQAERFFKPRMINGRMAVGRRPDQDLPAARHQGLPAVPARRPPADARRHGRVLQPGARAQADRRREAQTWSPSSTSCSRPSRIAALASSLQCDRGIAWMQSACSARGMKGITVCVLPESSCCDCRGDVRRSRRRSCRCRW